MKPKRKRARVTVRQPQQPQNDAAERIASAPMPHDHKALTAEAQGHYQTMLEAEQHVAKYMDIALYRAWQLGKMLNKLHNDKRLVPWGNWEGFLRGAFAGRLNTAAALRYMEIDDKSPGATSVKELTVTSRRRYRTVTSRRRYRRTYLPPKDAADMQQAQNRH